MRPTAELFGCSGARLLLSADWLLDDYHAQSMGLWYMMGRESPWTFIRYGDDSPPRRQGIFRMNGATSDLVLFDA